MISKTSFGYLKKSLCSSSFIKGETLRFIKGETLRFINGKTSRFIKPVLGRWTIHDSKETSLKVKYANEDNCGACCNNFSENVLQKNTDKKVENNDDFIYAMGYESVHNAKV